MRMNVPRVSRFRLTEPWRRCRRGLSTPSSLGERDQKRVSHVFKCSKPMRQTKAGTWVYLDTAEWVGDSALGKLSVRFGDNPCAGIVEALVPSPPTPPGFPGDTGKLAAPPAPLAPFSNVCNLSDHAPANIDTDMDAFAVVVAVAVAGAAIILGHMCKFEMRLYTKCTICVGVP